MNSPTANAKAPAAVSVVLPVYNGEGYIRQAMHSILCQTLAHFEVVVINDGSTDRTGAILQEMAAADPRIKLISRENRGLVVSLNEGVRMSQGRLIARMDADDIALPDRLLKQFEYMERHPECVCVGSYIDLIDHAGRRLVTWHQPMRHEDVELASLKGHGAICHPSAMIRRDALLEVGGYRQETYPAEDLDLWLRLAEIGQLANLPEVLLQYRMLPQSISGQAAREGKQRDAAKRACDEACARRGIAPTFEAHAAWRPTGGKEAAFQNDLQFGWWAFHSGEPATALHYGMQAWKKVPWSREAAALALKAWRLRATSRKGS
jgi:Glycosyl transferase family 2